MKPRVLFLDDDRYEMLGLVEALEASGMTVEYFSNPDECRTRLGREPAPDLVITDLLMSTNPETPPTLRRHEGVEFCRSVREEFGVTCPILVLTVVSTPSVHKEVQRFADDILVKPVVPNELIRRVRKALSQ